MIPQVITRKIIVLRKPGGLKQYILTLPKEYAEELEEKGIDTLLIAFNKGLCAFPKIPGFTEKAILTFLSEHPKLKQLFEEET
jgi:hypothetical protein